MSVPPFEINRLDHYGIVAGTIKELGLIELVDNAIGTDKREEVSTGECVAAMVLNGLGFTSQPLSLTERFFKKKPLELLFGRSGVFPEHFNKNKLSRALDKVYEYGCEKLFHNLSMHSCSQAGIDLQCNSLDTTSLSVTGEYCSDSDENAIELVYGHSKDRRPDLKQCVHEMMVSQDGGVPLMMKSHSGNSSDSTLFKERSKMLIKHFKDYDYPRYLIADGKLYSKNNSENLGQIEFITRISSTLQVVKDYIQKAYGKNKWLELNKEEKYTPFEVTHYGISQRWLIVCSTQSESRAKKQVRKRVLKEHEKQIKKLKEFSTFIFSTEEEALLNLTKLCSKLLYHEVSEHKVEKVYIEGKLQYQIKGIISQNKEKVQKAIQLSSCYVIGTNINKDSESNESIIKLYKNQNAAIENTGFRFLKDPKFFTQSFFIKKPERIEALLFIMTLSLLVYSIAQRKIRLELERTDNTLPNQINRPTRTPTLRWIFQMMDDIHVIKQYIGGKMIILIEGYTELKQKIISFFGEYVQNIYKGELCYVT